MGHGGTAGRHVPRAAAISICGSGPDGRPHARVPEERVDSGAEPRGRRARSARSPRASGPLASIFFLLAYPSIQEFGTLDARLDADAEYKKAAEPHATLPATDPGVPAHLQPVDVWRVPFMPAVEVPPAAAGNKPRIFELRTYESHSKRAQRDEAADVRRARRAGDLPADGPAAGLLRRQPDRRSPSELHLHADVRRHGCAREELGMRSSAIPHGRRCSQKPGYTDPEIVSNITSIILRPTAYSQV